MDIRTFGQTQRTLRRDNSRLSHEVERLTHDLADAQTANNLQRELHAADLDTERNKNEKLEVENDELRSLVDSIRSTYPELRPYDVAAIDAVLSGVPCAWDVYAERKSLIQANIALGNTAKQLRADLDNERNAHNATAAQLYAELADARAELDAMRQAHSVVAARMQAMGC
jgi:hypothetical protein